MNNKSDKVFKSLASAYVERDGAQLKSEMEALDKSDFKFPNKLDERIAWNIKKEKKVGRLVKYVSAAACLIIALFIFSNRMDLFTRPSSSAPIADTTSSKKYNLEFVSTKLPSNYSVASVDYDNGQAIYRIENDTGNEIIMLVETSENSIDSIESEDLRSLNINGTEVYGISKSDYSLLTYTKDDTNYTLTSKYNYLDLIEISKVFI